MSLDLIHGRNFSKDIASDSAGIIVNETAVQKFGFDDPIGRHVKPAGDFTAAGMTDLHIIGVVEDFHLDNFKNEIVPLVLIFRPSSGSISLKYQAGKTTEALTLIEEKWEQFNPTRPLQTEFMDQQFARKYYSEEKLSKLFSTFAILSIIIACLGLFGLAAFTSDQRKKEIGVRKVLGATVRSLMLMQLNTYTKLLAIALAVGLPVGHYLMTNWLENFSYRTPMSWFVYVVPAVVVVIFAWSTVSYISFKASVQNPTNNLHDE